MQPRILKEPTFYFLVIAAGISLLYWTFNNKDAQQLQIDWQEVEARILVTELTQGYPASEQQREEIESTLVADYILVMEAYELGLQNDARINDILAQKMRHVLSGNVIQPSDQELEDFYQEYLFRYQQPARITATELVFNTQDPLPEPLLEQLANGVGEQDLATGLNRIAGILPRVTQDDLESIFDADIARQAFTTDDATWVGPYQSNRGQHWLQIDERFPARTPSLEEIVDQVRLDWIT
ncbi:MAG: peptidyl-prolyl cis-trans isomerase, partial [Gammaproteobacteria bacterium]|nr:peptidyl-prolyl cis-trans isomerase [Gammaproteobacteria bacterium]